MKTYVPVGNFERHTGHCPTYIAWLVLDEARNYLRRRIPESYANKLARRAEAVFAKHEFWQAKFSNAQGRNHLLMGMRHWLASVLAEEKPALFRELPDSFKIGYPLPLHPTPKTRATTATKTYASNTSH